jgi:hypothetical protein
MSAEEKYHILLYEKHLTFSSSNPSKSSSHGPDGFRRMVGELEKDKRFRITCYDKELDNLSELVHVIIFLADRWSKPLIRKEIEIIKRFLANGGRLFVIYDSRRENAQDIGVNSLIRDYQIEFENSLLWDRNAVEKRIWYKADDKNITFKERVLISKNKGAYIDEDHPVTKGITEIWYWGCTIRRLTGKNPHEVSFPIRSSDNSFLAKPAQSLPDFTKFQPEVITFREKSYPIIACVKRQTKNSQETRIIAFGGLYVFANDSLYLYSHTKLFMNCINWLIEDEPKPIALRNILPITTKVRLFLQEDPRFVSIKRVVLFIGGVILGYLIEKVIEILFRFLNVL